MGWPVPGSSSREPRHSTSTTDVELLRIGAKFTWGRLLEPYEVGPYLVWQYVPTNAAFGETQYHLWLLEDGKWCDQLESYSSLDGALIGAICKRRNKSSIAARFMAKMLDPDPEDFDVDDDDR
jgi:hypothetical protein